MIFVKKHEKQNAVVILLCMKKKSFFLVFGTYILDLNLKF